MHKIKVKSALPVNPDGGFPVAFADKGDAYENGEAFVADQTVHELPLTANVKAALNDGRLVEADAEIVDEIPVEDEPAPVVEEKSKRRR